MTSNQSRPAVPDVAENREVDGELYMLHPNGGGLVSIHALVAPSARVAPGAMVKGLAIVGPNARLFHQSTIEDRVIVTGMASLRESSRIGGDAVVRGASLRGHAYVGGHSRLDGSISVENLIRLIDVELKGNYRFA